MLAASLALCRLPTAVDLQHLVRVDTLAPAEFLLRLPDLLQRTGCAEDVERLLDRIEVVEGDDDNGWAAVADDHNPLVRGGYLVHDLGEVVAGLTQRHDAHVQNCRYGLLLGARGAGR